MILVLQTYHFVKRIMYLLVYLKVIIILFSFIKARNFNNQLYYFVFYIKIVKVKSLNHFANDFTE